MAKAITEQQAEKLRQTAEAAVARKIESQAKQLKGFTPTEAGVIPEKVWQNLAGKQEANNG